VKLQQNDLATGELIQSSEFAAQSFHSRAWIADELKSIIDDASRIP
jgi:hypothetical protein